MRTRLLNCRELIPHLMGYAVGSRRGLRDAPAQGLRRLPKYTFLAGFVFLAGPVLEAEPPAATPPSAPALLAEVLPLLQAKYPAFLDLHYKQGDRLGDLIDRSHGLISLVTPKTSAGGSPILTALLPGNIIYWRLASFTPETNWNDLSAQLNQWALQGAEGIVLDLRSNIAPDDYAGAVQVADFFTPNQTPLFSFVTETGSAGSNQTFGSSSSGSPFHQPVVILTNHQTSGAAEALAACLKTRGALVVGRTTHGKAADFAEQNLSTGQVLRFAVGQVRLADGTPLWNHPVIPDISLTINDQAEKAALDLIAQHGVLDAIHEAAQRHRMSEAALVQGDNPEWDDYLAAHEKKPEARAPATPLVQDIALIDALGSLKAIEVSQRRAAPSATAEAAPELPSSVQ